MAKAIFTGEFHYSSRKTNAGWTAKPSDDPQYFPREFIDAAVKAGRATEVLPETKAKTASKGRKSGD